MALHELTTNAVKYGALGQKNGRLDIRWRVQAENGVALDCCRLEGKRRRHGANPGCEQGEPEMAGGLSRTLCPISSELGQLSRSNRTASIARSRFRSPDLRLRRSKMASSALRDRRILVVEDEYLIAMSLQDALENVGFSCRGPGSVRRKGDQTRSSPSRTSTPRFSTSISAACLPIPSLTCSSPGKFRSSLPRAMRTTCFGADMLRCKNCPKPYLFRAMEEALVEAMSRS